MPFCSDNVELTWMEGDLKVLWSREYWYKTVRTSLLISVSKNNEGLTPLSVFTPVENTHPQPLGLKRHVFLTPPTSSYLSLASSALPLKGLKPALGDAGLHGEAWPDRPREALRLRLLSKPCFLLLPSRLTRRRSLRPVGGGWLSSSPSSCCSVIWAKRKPFITFNSSQILEWSTFPSTSMQMANLIMLHQLSEADRLIHYCYSSFFSYFCLCTLCDQTNLQSQSNLINVELLNQIQISAFSTQMPLRHRLHALLLQAVHHIIERILVRQCCKSLEKKIRIPGWSNRT